MISFSMSVMDGTRDIRLIKFDERECEYVVDYVYQVPVKVWVLTCNDRIDEEKIDFLAGSVYEDAMDLVDREGYLKVVIEAENAKIATVLSEKTLLSDMKRNLKVGYFSNNKVLVNR